MGNAMSVINICKLKNFAIQDFIFVTVSIVIAVYVTGTILSLFLFVSRYILLRKTLETSDAKRYVGRVWRINLFFL